MDRISPAVADQAVAEVRQLPVERKPKAHREPGQLWVENFRRVLVRLQIHSTRRRHRQRKSEILLEDKSEDVAGIAERQRRPSFPAWDSVPGLRNANLPSAESAIQSAG